MKPTVITSTIAVGLLFTLSAFGQPNGASQVSNRTTTTTKTSDYIEQKELGGDQVVKFTGDELAAGNGSPAGSLMIRVPGSVRVQLIRPRMNFVTELLKSVENL